MEATRQSVLIAGGGIAGLEAALALADLAPSGTAIALAAPEPDFVLKPLTVEEPFTLNPAERRELAPALAEIGVEHVRGAVARVDPEAREVVLGDDSRRGYDYLVVCIGGRARPVYSRAETFWAARGDLPIDQLIERAATSDAGSMALVVPPGTSWALPLYELALLVRRRSEELGHGELALRLFTPEEAPLGIFGTPASEAVANTLATRRIEFVGSTYVTEAGDGSLAAVPAHEALGAAVVLALPVIEGAAIEGLPSDEHGFIPVDEFGRVHEAEGVYAAGDGTNFPVKQGGLATQQADAAAEHIAAELGAPVDPKPFLPVLRGQLITGMESLHLLHELEGGHGEGRVSLDYLWWPPQKVSGRYLSAWLGHEQLRETPDPRLRPLDVEVSFPHEWHEQPMTSGEFEPD